MQKELNEILDSYSDEMTLCLQKLLRIRSVEAEGKEGMPFGDGVQEALDFLIALSVEKGFECVNFDNYACEINFGTEKQSVGIVSHLDVVPEGEGWSFDPFGGEISEGEIYGRGAVDDKGPLVASFYACLALKESGLSLRKKIKHIIGTNEESARFPCIKYYKEHAEVPECGIVPDSWFPVAYAEKGIYDYRFVKFFKEDKKEDPEVKSPTIRITEMKGGEAFNIVAPNAYARLICNSQGVKLLEQALAGFAEKDQVELERKGLESGQYEVTAKALGKAAHASVPELGVNAIGLLLHYLGAVWDLGKTPGQVIGFMPETLFRAISRLAEKLGKDTDGSGLSIRYADDSGALTNNVGLISYKEGNFSITMNLRSPVTKDLKEMEAVLTEQALDAGLEFEFLAYNPYFYVDPESDAVKLLVGIYREASGDLTSKPKAHGGGSYARILPGFVPMGPYMQGEEPCFHRQDEHISCDRLLLMSKIYAEALYQLASTM